MAKTDCAYVLGIPIWETDECKRKRKAMNQDYKLNRQYTRQDFHTERTQLRQEQQAVSDIAKNFGMGVSPGEATGVAGFQALGTVGAAVGPAALLAAAGPAGLAAGAAGAGGGLLGALGLSGTGAAGTVADLAPLFALGAAAVGVILLVEATR